MKFTIYHNTRCSKSRQTLDILHAHGVVPDVVEYLNNPPDEAELSALLGLLNMRPRQLLRTGEEDYKVLGLADQSFTDDALIKIMVQHPKLIERPIVVMDGKKAVIGRPPENVLMLLE